MCIHMIRSNYGKYYIVQYTNWYKTVVQYIIKNVSCKEPI